MTKELEIGRLLRAGTNGFVVGCRVTQFDAPSFGALVRVPLENQYEVYGLIYDIHIDDDGLVRQLVTAANVNEAVIADNRENRNIPLEISVITIGYQQNGRIRHLLPPRPPLSLDSIYLCDPSEIQAFTNAGRFGYFRHVLRAKDVPVGELIATHLQQAKDAQLDTDKQPWIEAATKELIVLLREDYPTLMAVLSALSDAIDEYTY